MLGKVLVFGGGFLVVVGIVLIAVLVPLSLHRVASNEVALVYNELTCELESELLREGLHSIGPSKTLIKFETTQQTAFIDNMSLMTGDGIVVQIDLTVLYVLKTAALRQIIEDFYAPSTFKAYVQRLSASIVREATGLFTVRQLYLQREVYQTAMFEVLGQRFLNFSVPVTIIFVQVENIDLPDAVQDALQATTVAEQDIANAGTERSKQIQAAQIALGVATVQAAIITDNATREVTRLDYQTQQSVLTTKTRLQLRTWAFGNISAGLGRGGDFFVEAYLKPLVAQSTTGKTIVGI